MDIYINFHSQLTKILCLSKLCFYRYTTVRHKICCVTSLVSHSVWPYTGSDVIRIPTMTSRDVIRTSTMTSIVWVWECDTSLNKIYIDSVGCGKVTWKLMPIYTYLPPFRVWWFVYDEKNVPLNKTQLFWLDRGVVEHCFCEVLRKSNRFQ